MADVTVGDGENAQGNASEATTGTSFDFKAEFAHYLAQAAAIPEAERLICRANTDVMRANIRTGVASLSRPEIIERIRTELPSVNLESMKDLPRLGETVAHAARMVPPPPKSDDLAAAAGRAKTVRNSLRSQIEVLVDVGIVEDEEFAQLRGGKGRVNLANALTDSAALLQRHEAELAGKLAISQELIAEGLELGRFLAERVKPTAAAKPQPTSRSMAAETRDRLWTLLVRRYHVLRRVAAWLWLDEADKYVPPLKSYQRKRKNQATHVDDVSEGVPA